MLQFIVKQVRHLIILSKLCEGQVFIHMSETGVKGERLLCCSSSTFGRCHVGLKQHPLRRAIDRNAAG